MYNHSILLTKMTRKKETQQTLEDLQRRLKMKDDYIERLEHDLREKTEIISRLNSLVDKYQSVFTTNQSPTGPNTRRRHQGISAEPVRGALEFRKDSIQTYDKGKK